ncbi:unnamed protein product [Ceutorhynchus assimilis]|uniref:Secreted protein n=1 Tax=Ceutorhynchus assimilis TaxID=467358 RepID=A0A9N9N0C1_9CUCU|nr:unnamed protein product [Ceutorhynchus assimilis]
MFGNNTMAKCLVTFLIFSSVVDLSTQAPQQFNILQRLQSLFGISRGTVDLYVTAGPPGIRRRPQGQPVSNPGIQPPLTPFRGK